ncbi:MAG: hypothetical protein QGG40_15675, partial [Myxococcota bacterium]|nr:hypothetical protein [Myxococcota bacterium]
MERKELIRVEGLRSADPGSLSVLTQDVLRLPIAQIELVTVADLLALSELDDLPGELSRGLAAFREQ